MKRLLFLSGAEHGALDAWTGAGTDGCVLHLIRDPVETVAMAEIWGDPEDAQAELGALGFEVSSYAAEEHVERWRRPQREGGLTQIAAWRARPEITRDEARASWDEHVPLALATHGCANYVRNWVGAADLSGVAVLTYADDADYAARRYLGDRGRARIEADVARFMGSVAIMLAEPRVLRPRLPDARGAAGWPS